MTAMYALFPLMILPLLFLIACFSLLFMPKRNFRRASLYGLLAFFLFFALGTYSIFQSRGSTSGIGFLFLPMLALVPGVAGFILGKVHTQLLRKIENNEPASLLKTAMIILPLLLIAPFVIQVNTLLTVLGDNKASDIKAVEHKRLIKENRNKIKQLISNNPGKEKQVLEGLAKKSNDRTLLLPIAQNKFASPELLDKLGKSTDLGVALTVVRNSNTAVKTLIWVYENHKHPTYFYSALALNPKTPPDILHSLYEKRDINSGISLSLARNENIPKGILNSLLGHREKYVLRNILKRPNLTCEQLSKVNETIAAIKEDKLDWLIDLSNQKEKTCQR